MKNSFGGSGGISARYWSATVALKHKNEALPYTIIIARNLMYAGALYVYLHFYIISTLFLYVCLACYPYIFIHLFICNKTLVICFAFFPP